MWKYNRVRYYLEFQIEFCQYWLQEVLSLATKNTFVHTKEYLYKPDRILRRNYLQIKHEIRIILKGWKLPTTLPIVFLATRARSLH